MYVYACHVISLHAKTSNSVMMQNEKKMLQENCFSRNTFLLFKNRKHTNTHMPGRLQFFLAEQQMTETDTVAYSSCYFAASYSN